MQSIDNVSPYLFIPHTGTGVEDSISLLPRAMNICNIPHQKDPLNEVLTEFTILSIPMPSNLLFINSWRDTVRIFSAKKSIILDSETHPFLCNFHTRRLFFLVRLYESSRFSENEVNWEGFKIKRKIDAV